MRSCPQESQQSLDVSIKQQFKELLTYSNNHDILINNHTQH